MNDPYTKMQHATKTDLTLLLECLKYQMNSPDSQKQALLAIYNICQQNDENVEFFREMGGVMFVYDLSRSSIHSEVKETALFTLGTLTESNVYCKQALCRRETFSDLAASLQQQEAPLTQKRVAVYMLSALVANNRSGQTHAHISGCIHILLELFRWSFPLTDDVSAVNVTQLFQLWTSVSNALCGCVNNPQNEENQRVCMAAFPMVKTWLQQLALPRTEMAQPICSFIGMTVANNACAQQYFSSVGGLVTLTHTLARLVSQSSQNPVACRLATMITKTLSACITDNPVLAAGLAELQLVPELLVLLACPCLDPRDRLGVVLTLGLCTEACKEHQSQLLLGGGLPVMISLLTEAQDDELRKAATFVLQTCKQIMGALGGAGVSPPQEDLCDLESHWHSAEEMLKRIQHLEQLQEQACEEEWERDAENSSDLQHGTLAMARKALHAPTGRPPSDPREEFWEGTPVRRVRASGERRKRENTHDSIQSAEMTFKCPLTQPPRTGLDPHNLQNLPNQDLTGRVRRQIFRANETQGPSLQNPACSSGEREREKERELEREREDRAWETERQLVKERELERKREQEGETERNGHTHPSTPPQPYATDCRSSRSPRQYTYTSQPGGGDRDTPSPVIFRLPAPIQRTQRRQSLSEDEMSICSEILDCEIDKILLTPPDSKLSSLRCAGCVLGVYDVDSSAFSSVLRCCRFKCERHLVLQEAEDRFKRHLRESRVKHTHAESNTHTRAESNTHMHAESRPHTHRDSSTRTRGDSNTHIQREIVMHAGGPISSHTGQRTNTHTGGERNTHTSAVTNTHTGRGTQRRDSNTHTTGVTNTHTTREMKRTESNTHRPSRRDATTQLSLTPIRKGSSFSQRNCNAEKLINLTPLKRPCESQGRKEESGSRAPPETECEDLNASGRHRERRTFSEEELLFLLRGVQRFGPSWNSILWAYPFQPGRTNVDLAKKYRRLQKAKAQGLDLSYP